MFLHCHSHCVPCGEKTATELETHQPCSLLHVFTLKHLIGNCTGNTNTWHCMLLLCQTVTKLLGARTQYQKETQYGGLGQNSCTACIFTAKLYNCVTSCARTQKKETHGSENSFLLVIFLCLLIRFIIKIRTMQHTQARMTHKAQGHDGQRINPICIDQQSLLETSKIPWKSVAMYIWRQS